MLGSTKRILSKGDLKSKKLLKKYSFKKDLNKGDRINLKNVKFARPPGGISQNLFKKYKEKKLRKNLKAETILKKDHFINMKKHICPAVKKKNIKIFGL